MIINKIKEILFIYNIYARGNEGMIEKKVKIFFSVYSNIFQF